MAEPDPHRGGADAQRIGRVRRAVFERIAHACTPRHLTVRSGPDGWQPLLDGVHCKVLRDDGDVLSYLLQLAPGAVVPCHRHRMDEECMVLEGELTIGGDVVVRAGDYHLGRAGLLHAPIRSARGALVFLRGAAPECEALL